MKPHRRFAPASLRVLAFSAVLAVSAWMNIDAHAQAPDASTANQAAPPARLTQAIDEKNLVVLKGNVHPLARPEYDQGAVNDGLQLHRMLLLLQRSPDQEASLEKLLDDQQDKSSTNYHAWLTPQQFGQQFGPADADIQTVTTWLQSRGFQVTNVTAGRTLIEFSGTAGQVRSAFHTEIHNYLVNGEAHTANATDPQISAALAPVVVGPVSLNNFPITSHIRELGTFQRAKGSNLAQPLGKPLYTFPGCTPAGCFGLGPADFATIYNSAPLLSGTPKIDGTGQTIAIVGESDIDPTDVTDFQTMFGMTPSFSAANNIIVNGVDPGKNGSEGESDLDVQWAGAVAPGATIKFVTSQPTETTAGIFLSATYIVENNLAGVMSESFGGCEQQIGTLNQFHNSLWQQAAAQGITVLLSAGDGGSAGCDNFDTQQTATRGLGVSGFASTPYNVAVGGTDFDEINRWSQFWSSTNTSPSESSALSYIPEIPWNDSCAQLGINGCGASAPNGSLNIVAASGGVSTLYPKPSWQSGTGVPSDGHRDLPDVSLFASNGFDGTFYILCEKDLTNQPSCNLNALGGTFQGAGGTSASAPAFAGIMALVNQSQATAQNPAPRQGNANYVLYPLFKKQTGATPAINCNSSATPSTSCTFYDVTKGNSGLPTGVGTNSVPCTGGSPNCSTQISNGVLVTPTSSTTEAYTVTTGYDLVTGLGSVNIANLVKNWSSITSLASTTTLSATVNGQAVTSITGITHGTPVNVSSTVAAGQGANGTPSGQVALLATPNPIANSPGPSLGFDLLTLDNTGIATGAGVVLPGGQYNLTAHYQGDGTFGSSDSTPPISVNISAESSKTIISIPVFDPTTGRETGNAPTSVVYGSPYIARVDVGNAQAALSYPPLPVCTPPACPTGTITWTDSLNGAPAAPLDGGTFALNSSGYTEDQPIQLSGGMHVLGASYGGDKSFAASSGNYSLLITPAPTSQQWSPPGFVIVNQPFALATSVGTGVAGANLTGTVTFLDGTTPLPGTVTYMAVGQGVNAVLYANLTTTIVTGGSHTLTASYSGDANYAASTSSTKTVQALYSTSTAISLSAAEIPFGSSVAATVTVTTNVKSPAITGSILFQTASGQPATPLSVTTSTDANGNTILTAMTTVTPQGPGYFTAGYSGDSNFASSNASVFIQVDIPDFSLNVPSAPVVINIGQTGMLTFNVTPASNTPSSVALSCAGPPVGYACTIQPAAVNLANGTSSTATLTLAPQNSASQAVKSASATRTHTDHRFVVLNNPMAMAGLLAGLSIAILSWPGKKNPRPSALWFAVVCLIGLFGCGGGSSGGGGGPGLFATTVTLTSSAPKSAPFASVTFTATVSGQSNPTGNVTFLSGPDIIGQVALINGTASATTAFGNPGIWAITAQYGGDGRNQGSTSPVLNQGVTGNVSSVVQGQTGTLTRVSAFTITMQ